jgi:catechol 2,3-dioxygenase-like lactoylglutathione lyase family enzyme
MTDPWQPLHVATMLVVADLDRSVAFYRDRLGFAVREQHADLALFALGPMLLYLVTHSPPTPDKPGVTLTCTNANDRTAVNLVFRVADCRAAHAELARRGVAFLAPPQSPPWGGWRCFARDPDGYLLEVEQPA